MQVNTRHSPDLSEKDHAQRLIDAVLASIADPLLVFDANWRLLLLNPAAAAVFGQEVVPGAALADVLQADVLVAFVEGSLGLAEWTRGDKTFAPRVEAFADGWILVLRDMTQYKKLNRSQNEYIHIVSHDIRTPLTSMNGYAEILGMAGDLNEKQQQCVEKVQSGITKITALIDNIQDAGRFDPETGFYEMSRSPCDLREIVAPIVNNHLIPAEKQELTLSMSLAGDVPIINADTNMLSRAILNLIDNAIKYTPNGGKIDVIVARRDNSVVVSVRDSGLGISPEHQKQIFERGTRVQRQEHRKIRGSGLGLFIVRSVALRHGGDAWVESELGKGSTFSFNIPLTGANLVVPDESAS